MGQRSKFLVFIITIIVYFVFFFVLGRSYEDLDIGGATELLEELAAMAARGGGNSQVSKTWFRIEGKVGDEELLGVDGLVEGETREFKIDPEKDPTRGSHSDCSDVVVRDWRASQGLGGFDQRREELEHGLARLFGHLFGFGGLDHESGSIHFERHVNGLTRLQRGRTGLGDLGMRTMRGR